MLGGVTDQMTVAREEIFGPVISALPFDSIDEVLDSLDCDLRFDDYVALGANRYLALALWSCFRSLACTAVPDSTTA